MNTHIIMSDIHAIRLGLTLGLIFGISVFILSFIAPRNYGIVFFGLLEDVYIGCNRKTFIGKFLCGFMAFLDAFIGGVLIGYIYNHLNAIKY